MFASNKWNPESDTRLSKYKVIDIDIISDLISNAYL